MQNNKESIFIKENGAMKICPFCGEKEELYIEKYHHSQGERYRAFCGGCCAGIDTGWSISKSEVIEFWNRRVKENF